MIDPKNVQQKYNTMVGKEYVGRYEEKRWFSDEIQKAAYDMTKNVVEKQAMIPFQTYLELGPGPGTWTSFFVSKNHDARFDVVDISEEMMKKTRERFAGEMCMRFFVTDFMAFQHDATYDYFFSSRALEYFPDKKAVVQKIYGLLASGGTGCIITKMPKYWRNKIKGMKVSEFHSAQIAPRKLKQLLTEQGFLNVRLLPVTVSVPFFHSPRLNLFVYRLFSRFHLNFFMYALIESYAITFRKP